MDFGIVLALYALSALVSLLSFYLTVVVMWFIYETTHSPDKHLAKRMVSSICWPLCVIGYFYKKRNNRKS